MTLYKLFILKKWIERSYTKPNYFVMQSLKHMEKKTRQKQKCENYIEAFRNWYVL